MTDGVQATGRSGMLQTEGTVRRAFWWVLAIIAGVAGVVTWQVLGTLG